MSGTPLIEVVTPATAAAGRDGQGRWVYLGKSVTLRRRVEAVRARPREPLGRGLQVIARELRQPFLDFVADIGAAEPDAVSWWSTTFSWKVWGASDLFLLVCYLKAAQELIDEALDHGADLTLVVEDDWLAHQIADANAPRGVRCRRRPLAAAKIGAFVLGTARRLAWLGQTLGSWRRQRRFTGRAAAVPRATAAIYTYPMTRCLRDAGGYADALLPGMDDLLRECGHRVMFFSPPERGGFEAELAARRQYFRPLILDSSAGAVIRSLFAMWRPRVRTWPLIAGLRVDHLACREYWRDAARAQWCRYRHFYECARKMLTDEALEWVVFPFENQPWEKLLVLAARERGVRTAGVQHSTLAT
ncbi:MAG: hypothetical protein EPO35_04940, partial [Acidobacteria bacterium]